MWKPPLPVCVATLIPQKQNKTKKTPTLKKTPNQPRVSVKKQISDKSGLKKNPNPGNRNAHQAEDTTLKTKQKQIHKDIGNPLLLRNFTESKYCQPPKQLKS